MDAVFSLTQFTFGICFRKTGFFFFQFSFFFCGQFNNSAAAAIVKEIFLAYHNKC